MRRSSEDFSVLWKESLREKMAELKFKIIADTSELLTKIKEALRQKLKIEGVEGGGSSQIEINKSIAELRKELKSVTSKKEKSKDVSEIKSLTRQQEELKAQIENLNGGAKKSNSILGQILKGLGVLGILQTFRPAMDALTLIAGLIGLLVLKFLKFVGDFPTQFDLIKAGLTKVWEWIKLGWDLLAPKLQAIKDKIIEWFQNAVAWLKELPAKIWEKMKIGWELFKEKVKELKDKLVERLLSLWEGLKSWFSDMKEKVVSKLSEVKDKIVDKLKTFWDGLKERVLDLRDKLVTKFKEFKELAKDKLEALKTRLGEMWDTLKNLPLNIWNYVKGLGAIIASKIKETLKSLNPFNVTDSVDDAIITNSGKVIKTNPNDTLIATQTPGSMGGQTVINFYGMTMDEAIEKVKRELSNDQISYGRF